MKIRRIFVLGLGIGATLGCQAEGSSASTADTSQADALVANACSVAAAGQVRTTSFTAPGSSFDAEWDVVPSSADVDAAVALGKGPLSIWTDFAAIVRFRGAIDARNGTGYQADASLAVASGVTYHVRMVVDVPGHRYSAFVTPEGGSEIQIAKDYAFRGEQSGVASLDTWSAAQSGSTGTLSVCGFSIRNTVSGGGGGTGDSGASSGGGGGGGGSDAGSGSSGGGGTSSQLFPSDSPWYRDVSSYPVASQSGTIIGAIGSWGNGGHFDVDFAFNVEHANAGTPHYTPHLDSGYDPDNDHTAVPIPAGGALENEDGYRCTTGGDCHLIVIDDSTHKLFEIWQADFDGSQLNGTQETVWDLLRHYDASGRGYGCTSADAAGMSILAGTIGVKETHAGSIDHAIRFILPNSKIRSAFVAPATHLTGAASSSNGPPYGTRLRMKASFDESQLPSEGAKIVARALKKYGMILADGGQTPISAEKDQLYPASLSWSGLLDFSDLRSVKVSDFDVVDFGTVRTDGDCVRNP